jgi:endonuclease YncB( thermonuclease family)
MRGIMPIRPPRRIFRSSSRASGRLGGGVRPAVLVGLIGTLLAVAVMLLALPDDLFGRVPPLRETLTVPPDQVAVVDGETLVLRQVVVRLQGIAAPPRGHPCAAADGTTTDCGVASTNALAALVRGHQVACRLDGRDRKGFAWGVCEAAGTELNRDLVRDGWARASNESPDFAAAEAEARRAGRGLWHDGSF